MKCIYDNGRTRHFYYWKLRDEGTVLGGRGGLVLTKGLYDFFIDFFDDLKNEKKTFIFSSLFKNCDNHYSKKIINKKEIENYELGYFKDTLFNLTLKLIFLVEEPYLKKFLEAVEIMFDLKEEPYLSMNNMIRIFSVKNENTLNPVERYFKHTFKDSLFKKVKILNVNDDLSLYYYQTTKNGKIIKIILRIKNIITYGNYDYDKAETKVYDYNNLRRDGLYYLFNEYYEKELLEYNLFQYTFFRFVIETSYENIEECKIDNSLLYLVNKKNSVKKTKTAVKKEKKLKKLKALNKIKNDDNNSNEGDDDSNKTETEKEECSSSSNISIDDEGEYTDENTEIYLSKGQDETYTDESNFIEEEPKQENIITYPFNITFYTKEFFSNDNKDYIKNLFHNLYDSNTSFQDLMNNYDTIHIIKNFHTDGKSKDNSLHLTIVIINNKNNKKTDTLHSYIKNNCITTITKIQNII